MSEVEAPLEPRNPWLIMLYLAGDNSLSEDMVLALQDLKAEGRPTGDKIVAQFDPSGVGLFTQRYDFSAPEQGNTLEDYRVKTYDGAQSNTGSGEAPHPLSNGPRRGSEKRRARRGRKGKSIATSSFSPATETEPRKTSS